MRNSLLKAFALVLGLSMSLQGIGQTKTATKTGTTTKTSTTKSDNTKKTTSTDATKTGTKGGQTTKEPVKADPGKTTETTKTAGTPAVAGGEDPGILGKHSKAVQAIFKNEKGVFRGYTFGTSLDEVKKTETAQYVADGKDFALYKMTVNDKEEVEILYYLDEKKNIKAFGIEFPVHISKKDEAELIDDLQKYFNERFGAFVV
ncbi:MAG: hypothetical protein ACJ75J_15470, partial [Cytophagaceae bacterium]